jgi:RNA polymerase sigma-70 factor (ECF subfamily)
VAISDREIPSFDAAGPDRDRVLVAAHRAGDHEAFPTIVQDHFPSLMGHAVRRLHDQGAAEDAVQETLLRAYRGLATFNGDYRIGAWLHRILSNVCVDEFARRRREELANERWALEPHPTATPAEDVAANAEAVVEVARAIAGLPGNYREALVLRDIYELEYADVASQAGISEENARARVHRARAALRRIVDGSASIGAFVFGGFRRGMRWIPRLGQHVSTSAATIGDAATAPSRVGYALTAVATTSAAVAAVAAPIIGSKLDSSPPQAPPAAVVVSTPPATGRTAGQPVASLVQAGIATPGSSTTSTLLPPTTVTTAVATPGGIAGPGPQVVATLASASLTTDSGGGLVQDGGQVTIGSAEPVEGSLISQLVLPPAGDPACTGSLAARLLWTAGSARYEVDVTTVFASAQIGSGTTVYKVSGQSTAIGKTPLPQHSAVVGTVAIPADGSAGQLHLELMSVPGSVPQRCTVPPQATTTQPPPAESPTTAAPPTTQAAPTTQAPPTTQSPPTSAVVASAAGG